MLGMGRTGVRATAVTVVSLLALALSGCGSDKANSSDAKKGSAGQTLSFAKKPPGIIAKTAFDAMDQIHKVHAKGTMTSDGQPVAMDVRTDGSGNCTGTLTQEGATTRFVATAHATYLKGDAAFWRQNAGKDAAFALSYLHGRWAKVEASKEFANLCDLGTLISQAGADIPGDPAHASGTVSKVQQYQGHDVIEVSASEGKKKFRFLVEVAEPHRLFRLSSDTPGDRGEIVFNFDDSSPVVVPGPKESTPFGD
jgi:hypothetical protein